jgi:NADP-dependent aldehyde dehydrogenase
MTIEGKQIIGYELSSEGSERFFSYDPALAVKTEHSFHKATSDEVSRACEKASLAFAAYRKKTGAEKAEFLEAIVAEINSLGDLLVETCCRETALPKGRIEGERGRTTNQLLMFANLLREGSWVDARIEQANPTRTPVPKPDLRYMHLGLGPVVVFGASNFPLAFSVAGGDTASALAAGCPVIVKAHSAHPATAELVGKAIRNAAKLSNMPDGVFSLLHGEGSVTGMQLVNHEAITAVALTGSFKAGKALFDAAVKRKVPIPVYAEMGSTNPVFILPGAMKTQAEKIAQGFATSVTLGVGQFCTNPGVLIYDRLVGSDEFTKLLQDQFAKTTGGPMLTEGIFAAYTQGVAGHQSTQGMEILSSGQKCQTRGADPILFKTTGTIFNKHGELSEEIFGPTSVVVEAGSRDEMISIAQNLGGHLTATVHGTEEDLIAFRDLLDILEQKVGRLVINGFPTGVEVCSAMLHGGPYPATTDGRSTSVGTAAIYRFTRAVSYQGMPQSVLPKELKNQNPLKIWRLVDGVRTNGVIN